MEFIENKNGKITKFRFKSKKEELEYIDICETIWGCVPYDVNWAQGTNIYKNQKEKNETNKTSSKN